MGDPPVLRVELDRLASLGPVLRGLANEAASLRTGPYSSDVGEVEPAVAEAASIANELVDSELVNSIKNRLDGTGEIMIDVANEYRKADEAATSLGTVMQTYTNATGDWIVPAVPSAAQSTGPPPAVTYTVVRGDTLWAISERFYADPTRYPQIAAANGIDHPNSIYPGQVMTIPKPSVEQNRNAK